MSEVLIVGEQTDSHVSKPALELHLARRLGEPIAVASARPMRPSPRRLRAWRDAGLVHR